ncbi:MAG: winged helix-turn-helix domain-containing protein [Chloroflexi bacterium]|nr:winged helix-turn-helix domain-containing protein [Chloroflexota bacterium]
MAPVSAWRDVGTTLSRDGIIEHLWVSDFVAGGNLVDRHLGKLRTKLNDNWRRPR